MTSPNFSEMTAAQFEEWKAANAASFAGVRVPEARQLPEPGLNAGTASVDPYAAAAASWGNNEFDFRVPSGFLCRMRKMPLKEIAAVGILDEVTRLPGLVNGVIQKAENAPPEATPANAEMIDTLDILLNKIIPIVVVKPQVWPLPAEGEERVVGRIYADTVDFMDRVAIMDRAMQGVAAFDSFRKGSQ